MKVDLKIVMVAVTAVAVGALFSWVMMRDKQDGAKEGTSPVVRHVAMSKKNPKVKKVTEISLERKDGKNAVRIVETELGKPKLDVDGSDDDDGEEKLTELQKSVIRELQNALDANDLKAVRRVLSKFSAAATQPHGGLGKLVPKTMRLSAVQALGWFGKDAAVDLIGFMADVDSDVVSEAYDQFEMALQDCTMGDFERAEILKAAMHAITDPDHIDTLLNALMNMRNSCKYETIKDIFQNGTEAAKALMREQLEFYTEPDVTVETLEKWAAMHPDDDGDEDFYGGSKSDGGSQN